MYCSLQRASQRGDGGVGRAWVSCNACGADAFVERLTRGEWHIGQCSVCSLIYVNPMPIFSPTSYTHLSHDFYYTRLQRQITPARVDFERRQLASQLEKASPSAPPPGAAVAFLDVGCGPGLAVRAAADLGWEAVGLDIDSDLVELGRRALGVDLRCNSVIEARLGEGRFHLVRFKSVLHLLPNPYDVLVEVRRVLRPGGVVLVIVPNENGLLNQLNLLLGRRRTNRLGTLILPYHSHAFTPGTLTRLLDRAGLRPHGVETTTPTDPTYASISYLEHRSLRQQALRLVWEMARALHRGSVLIAYAGKSS
jgi:2-polyprenyl-3-methyl-5-hydroxy-6-metoxy-1,4-benzoquinol methylase